MATLAEILRQAGYVTPQGVTGPNAPLARQLKNYVTNVIPTAAQNLAQQRADIDASLTMGDQGIQVGDREAFERQMAQVPNLMGLTAYHGTPHTIKGKFDISKVGTGEGAQAYGHGMYFAENPSVAKEYQRKLSGWDTSTKLALGHHGGIDNAIAETEKRVNSYKTGNWAEHEKERANRLLQLNQKKLEELQAMKAGMPEPTGNLYKVDIPDADIPNMLNWELPINQQSAKVQEIAKQLDPNLLADTPHLIVRGQARHWTEVVDNIEDLQNPRTMKLLKKIYGEGAEIMPYGDYLASKMTGEQLYRNLSNPTQWAKEAAPYAMKAGMEDAAVSAKLNELGVKGIRYKDAMSRGADDGTSNFVVFDPSQVKILEQNNKPVTQSSLQSVVDPIRDRGLTIDAYESKKLPLITLSRIEVPKDLRSTGMGTQALQELAQYADQSKKTIALSPSKDFGASSVSRLKDFYKRFGFVENKGKNKDFTISESMYRLPTQPTRKEILQEQINKIE